MKNWILTTSAILLSVFILSNQVNGMGGMGGGGGGGGGISISPPPTPQEVLPPKPIIVAPIFVKQKHHKRKLMTYHTGFPGMGPAGMMPPSVIIYHFINFLINFDLELTQIK
jgi:hypothetical protein